MTRANQEWHQDKGLEGYVESGDRFGNSLAVGDFDNDGYDDLIVGAPWDSVGSITRAGVVNTIYGSGDGLTRTGNQTWHQDKSYINGTAESGDKFGESLAVGDFDNDGYDDLVVGAPDEDIGSEEDAGGASVIYGSRSGLTSSGDQHWDQTDIAHQYFYEKWTGGTGWITEKPTDEDHFGGSLAVGDFDNDGYDDLAVGVPDEDLDYPQVAAPNDIDNFGVVNLIYGSSDGLTKDRQNVWHQDTPGPAFVGTTTKGAAEDNDNFGESLAVGDFDNDGYDDLVVGVPYEDIGSIKDAGIVNVIYNGSGSDDQTWHQDKNNINETAQGGDHFGESLAVGDFDNDGYDDLAIGVPDENLGSIKDAGMVNIIYGSGSGLTSSGDQNWHQDKGNINGVAETGDRFGESLAVGDFDGDGYDDLAIGVPQEGIGSKEDAGMVNVIYGSGSGLTDSGDQTWHQDTPGIKGVSEGSNLPDPSDIFGVIGDSFGSSLSAGDFNNDGYDDLAIGVPGEDVGSITNGGMANIIYGSASGLVA